MSTPPSDSTDTAPDTTVGGGGTSPVTTTVSTADRQLARDQFNTTALLGGATLALFAVVYVIVKFRKSLLSTTFARIYALVAVVIFGVLLAFANVASDARTAGFTLLGTVAGFLAAAKNTTTNTTTPQAAPAEGGKAPEPIVEITTDGI